jgi:TonB-dependent receptor
MNVSYKRSASFYDDGFTGRYEPPSGGENETLPPAIQLDDSRGTEEAQLGAVFNLNYNLTQNNSLSADVIFSNVGTATSRFQSGPWPRENTFRFDNRTLTWSERRLLSTQVRGEHLLPSLGNTTVEWDAAFSDTQQEEPDSRFFANQAVIVAQDTILGTSSAGFSEPRRVFRDLSESSYSGKLDISVPLPRWSGSRGTLKIGGAYKTDERSFNERIFVANPSSQVRFTGDEEEYFSDANVGVIRDDAGNVEALGHVFSEQTQSSSIYDGDRTIAAGYAMVDLPITSSFRIVGGARLETTDLEVVSRDTSAGIGRIDEADLLPALNLVYNVQDNMNVRAAVSRTLARPTFREISPFERLNGINLDFVIGNPNLGRTLITNTDLRWEWFMRPGEILAISTFYKVMDDPIEEVLLGSTNGQETWDNSDQAEVYGAEFEARIRLDRLNGAFQYFTFGGNLSLVQSSVDISEREATEDESRSLQGQSPYTVNADLSYNNPESGTSAGVYFNVFGERLTEVALRATPDVFEQPFTQLNATFSQRFMDHWTVSASVENILGDEFREVQEFQGETFVFQEYEEGRTISLGLSYEL